MTIFKQVMPINNQWQERRLGWSMKPNARLCYATA